MSLVKVIIVDIGEDGKDIPNTTYVIKRQSWVHLWLGLLFTRHKRHGSLPHNSLLQKRGKECRISGFTTCNTIAAPKFKK